VNLVFAIAATVTWMPAYAGMTNEPFVDLAD
jgi:hypothetical protein